MHSCKLAKSLLLLLFPAVSIGQTVFADTAKKLDALFAYWNRNTGPGVSIEVSRNGQTIYANHWGMADLEHRVAIDSSSIFEAGSVSKQFTAAAVLLLEEQGKLSQQDDIRKYFPELPDYGKSIRIYHLLHHTSGLRDWGSMAAVEGWPRGSRTHSNADALAIICRQKVLNNIPGAEYIYSNSNFNLLAILTERVSGMSFADFCKKYIFDKAGMKMTGWRNNFRAIIPNRAIGYSPGEKGLQMDMPFENAHGNGGLLTTAHDLTVWSWQTGTGIFDGSDFRRKQWERGKLNNGREITYAAGLVIDRYKGHELVTHSGATAGYRANLDYYPKEGLVIALLSNDAFFQPVGMARKVADIFLQQGSKPFEWPAGTFAADQSTLKQYAGWYRNTRTNEGAEIKWRNDSLLYTNGKKMLPVAADAFLAGDLKLAFQRKKGGIQFYAAGQENMPDTVYWQKEKPALSDKAFLQELAGNYSSEEANAQVQLFVKADTLYFKLGTADPMRLTATYLHAFSMDDGDLLFQVSAKGKASGFTLSVSRARNIVFLKIK